MSVWKEIAGIFVVHMKGCPFVSCEFADICKIFDVLQPGIILEENDPLACPLKEVRVRCPF